MRSVFVFLVMVACGKTEPTSATTPQDTDTTDTETTPPTDTETDLPPTDSGSSSTTGDTGGGTTPPACDSVNAGNDWAWRGSCPGMLTPCTVQVTGCQLAIGYPGGMTMGMPTGGLVAGSDVSFNGANGVTGCAGTVTDPDSMEGTCDGGCSFTLTR